MVDAPHLADITDPFNTDAAQQTLNTTLHQCDDGELYVEQRRTEQIAFEDGHLKTASYGISQGFGLRAVAGEAIGYAHNSNCHIDALKQAANALSPITAGYSGTVDLDPEHSNQHFYDDIDPLKEPGFASKIDTLQQLDAYIRARDPRIFKASMSLAAEQCNVTIHRRGGDHRHDHRPLVRIGVHVVARDGDRRETGMAGGGGRAAYTQWLDPMRWQEIADEAIRQALLNLDSVPAPAGEMDVVLGPGWPGILLHEAIGHGLEGDFNRKQTSAFSGRVGERIAAPGITVVDDGTLLHRRGSLSIDDEGTPTNRTVLIENGILKGYLQDRLNARLMGVAATGNGRRQSYAHAPMPRMTNTYMLNGDRHPGELIAAVKDGLYATSFGGGQVDITSGKFVFSCTEAYRIRNGKIAEPVKDAALIGDGPTILTRIAMIGNDMKLDDGIGTCGKDGQLVPVGVGQPSLLIRGITVGGASV